MKIITFSNGKGGVGKTSLSTNIAYLCSADNKKTLLIDLDSQSNSSYLFNKSQLTSYDLLTRDLNIDDCAENSGYENLDIISADFRLKELRNLSSNTILLNKITDSYDYIIIDSSPSLDDVVENAIVVSDLVVIPALLDVYSYLGIQNVVELINDLNKDAKKLVVPNFKIHNSSLHDSIYNQLIEYTSSIGVDISSPLPNSVEISNNVALNQILVAQNKNNKLRTAIIQLYLKEIKNYG